MLTIRKSDERGHANHGWLDSYHTFSFANYYDPNHMGFRHLRVINQDWIEGGKGFGTHPHRDMEIITYMLEGALEHKDSMGNREVIHTGEVQRMTAGTGVSHSEYNHSAADPARLLQIWILPDRTNLPPSYEQKHFSPEEKQGKLRLIVSPDGRDGSLTMHQDVNLYATLLEPGETVTHSLAPQRHAWVQVAKGTILLNGTMLAEGDAAAVSDMPLLTLEGKDAADVLVFDMA